MLVRMPISKSAARTFSKKFRGSFGEAFGIGWRRLPRKFFKCLPIKLSKSNARTPEENRHQQGRSDASPDGGKGDRGDWRELCPNAAAAVVVAPRGFVFVFVRAVDSIHMFSQVAAAFTFIRAC